VKPKRFQYVYGPVPSRRLGRSLGLDLVPYKTCTYDCVYCQLGRTTEKTLERRSYAPVEEILSELKEALRQSDSVNYITCAGSGEPTLHVEIGTLIRSIKKSTSIPVAVLTNGSLLHVAEVSEALRRADLVIPSLDAGYDHTFEFVNRPHEGLTLQRVVEGLKAFRKKYEGKLYLEVMLLRGLTGVPAEVKKIAQIVSEIQPDRVQLNTPTRPPCEPYVLPVPTSLLEEFKSFFSVPVDVVTEKTIAASEKESPEELPDDRILELVKRRPCTDRDVASGLGLSVCEATKRLAVLHEQGLVVPLWREGKLYFAPAK